MERLARNRLVRVVLKKGRFVVRPIKKVATSYEYLKQQNAYNVWAERNEQLCHAEDFQSEKDKVSVIVPAFNTDRRHLLDMVYSVINQHYQNWELIIVNASTQGEAKAYIAKLVDMDTRISVVDPGKNLGIAENTNFGIDVAKGTFVAFLDHDDTLHPCALHSLMAKQKRENADLIYSDEDKITHQGDRYFGPLCKPDWSPHLFEYANYINHLTIVRKSLIDKVGKLSTSHNGAQDYEFLLRVIDGGDVKIAHSPNVLYHWRAARTSTANDISTKPYIFKSGQSALIEHFKRARINASVEIIKNKPGHYKPVYDAVKFDVIVHTPSVMNEPSTALWVQKMGDLGVENSLIVGRWYEKYSKDEDGHVVYVDSESSGFLGAAEKKVKQHTAIVFRSAATPVSPESLAELAAVSYGNDAVVQPLIMSRDGISVEDAGIVRANQGDIPLFVGCKPTDSTFFGGVDWVRDIDATRGLVFAVPKNQLGICGDRFIAGKKRPILWAHAQFRLGHLLEVGRWNQDSFNPLLSGTKSYIRMNNAAWPEKQERAHE